MTIADAYILVLAEGGLLQQSIVLLLLNLGWRKEQLLVASTPREATKLVASKRLALAIIGAYSLDQHYWVCDIHYALPKAPILALHIFPAIELQEKMAKAGARGIFSWKSDYDEIVSGVKTVLAGELCFSTALEQRLFQRRVGHELTPRPTALETSVGKLSQRELQVFGLLGHGMTTKQIAASLHLSPKSVETYRENIKEKMGLRGGGQLSTVATSYVLTLGQ